VEYESIYAALSYLESVEEKIKSARYYLSSVREKLEINIPTDVCRDIDLVEDALLEALRIIKEGVQILKGLGT